MDLSNYEVYSTLILRLAVGSMLIFQGINRFSTSSQLGLTTFQSLIELLLGAAIFVGIFTTIASLIAILLFAIYLSTQPFDSAYLNLAAIASAFAIATSTNKLLSLELYLKQSETT